MTGENAGSNAGSLADSLAGNAGSGSISLAETLASRFLYDVKYWTLEQAEAYPFWPPTEGKTMTEYRFHWVGTVKVWGDYPQRWVSGSVIRGTFTAECEDDDEARLAFDEESDRFMDRDFLSGQYSLDGGGPENDEWELNQFHVYRVEAVTIEDEVETEIREISPEREGASR